MRRMKYRPAAIATTARAINQNHSDNEARGADTLRSSWSCKTMPVIKPRAGKNRGAVLTRRRRRPPRVSCSSIRASFRWISSMLGGILLGPQAKGKSEPAARGRVYMSDDSRTDRFRSPGNRREDGTRRGPVLPQGRRHVPRSEHKQAVFRVGAVGETPHSSLCRYEGPFLGASVGRGAFRPRPGERGPTRRATGGLRRAQRPGEGIGRQ